MKKKKSKKIKSIPKLTKEVWKVCSEYIRKRDCLKTTGTLDYGLCITCGTRHHYFYLDAGHFIPVSVGRNAVRFDEQCIHAQCKRCNGFLEGNRLEYRRQIIKMYGARYDEVLEARSREITKFTRQDLLDIKEWFQYKIDRLEMRA